ncbi:MAG: anthranilate synthase component I [Candidatus Mycalebacterium zealandia]|nr:MAG: anthranilate synthase component I [Candidatus Mycalebacterium zealandia]
MIKPSFDEFRKKLKSGNVIPVWDEVPASGGTPVSAFAGIDEGGHSFLFESVEGGDKWARYSFLGSGADCVFRARGDKIEIEERGAVSRETGDPFECLRTLLGRYKFVEDPVLPRFAGGAVGYMSYDAVRFIEKLPRENPDVLGVWDFYFMIAPAVLIFDNVKNDVKTVVCAHCPEGADAREVYDSAVREIERLKKAVSSPDVKRNGPPAPRRGGGLVSNFEKDDFENSVNRVKEYIKDGDIIQAVISQRWSADLDVSPFTLYKALRVLNPSPYMFFLKMPDQILVGSSPEVMARVEDGVVESRPIAGTRPRGADEKEDLALEKELLSDEKERAEHIMLVDLARNDLGRIAKPGTVRVDSFMNVERYSHVMHIVSNIKGAMTEGTDVVDVVKATFPCGTLSGAPKVRAMEIIEEIEPDTRGPYGGTVGYMSFSGEMDTCITIRTFLIKDGKIHVQAGAGIVADSDPAREYEETVNKAKGLLKALEKAREME